MTQDANKVAVNKVFKVCPECGYKDGFHIMLEKLETESEDNTFSVKLICPSCSQIYDVGLKANI